MTASDRADVVVIGGGLLGAAVAWYLAKEGVDCVLLEADQVNSHASGQNAGSLHFQLEYRMISAGLESARRAAEAMPLHLDAARTWATLSDDLGEDLGVAQTGGLMLAENDEQATLLEAKCAIERSWGLEVEMLDRVDLAAIAPYLSDRVVAAARCPSEGKANTRRAAPALARAASGLGASIRTRHRVTRIERRPGGWHVRGMAGQPSRDFGVDAGAVVIAAGVWTTQIGHLVDVALPTSPAALTMTVTARTPKFIGHLVQHAGARLSLKQSADGNVLIGGGWPSRLARTAEGHPDLSRRPTLIPESLLENARAAIRAVPAVGNLPVLRTWTGTTSETPDQLPLLGPIEERPGLFVATGGSAFTLGPSYARLLAAVVQGRQPELDISSYRVGRFRGAHVA